MKGLKNNVLSAFKARWTAAAAALACIVAAALYGVTSVGEFSAAAIVFSVFAAAVFLLYMFTGTAYTDVAGFVLTLVSLIFLITSKAFYISAVFVGIDYSGFDPVFTVMFVFMLLAVIAGFAAAVAPDGKNKKEADISAE